MKTKTFVVLIVVLIVSVAWSSASAQDFSALLDAVDKIDAELKQLVEKEAAARAAEMAELREAIDNMPAGTVAEPGKDWSEEIAGLTTAILELKAELTTLKNQPEQAGDYGVQEELAMLGAEVDALRQQLQDHPELASTDPDSYSMAMVAGHHEEPAESSVGGIEWSGFFDVVSSVQTSADDENDWGLGQAEVDLASELADNVAVEAAIAYNADDGVFELGAALIGINLYGGEGFLSSLDITAGQFDVPFGIDWHEYPSIEGTLVTGPSVVHYTHDGWNDVGFQFGLEATHGNFVFYAVNGFESSVEILDEVATLATGEDVYEEVDTSPANAIGTRIGIAPFSWFEVGSSLATGWNVDGKSEMSMVGADLQFHMAGFELRGEYIAHSVNRSIAEENNRGYYAHLTYEFLHKAYVTTRYGSFKAEHHDWHGQSSIGAGYMLNEAVSLRLEQIIDENSDHNQSIMQIVAGF